MAEMGSEQSWAAKSMVSQAVACVQVAAGPWAVSPATQTEADGPSVVPRP